MISADFQNDFLLLRVCEYWQGHVIRQEPNWCAATHSGDDLKTRLLLLVDFQARDQFPENVCHFFSRALQAFRLSRPKCIKDVVCDFRETTQSCCVGIFFKLLLIGTEFDQWFGSFVCASFFLIKHNSINMIFSIYFSYLNKAIIGVI